MNIQPLGSPTTARVDDRPAAAPAPSAPVSTAQPAASDAAAARKAATPPSRADVDAAVKKLNESMQVSAQSLEFSVDQDSKEIVVKLIDQDTKEVVRQIPSEEALQIAKSIDKMQGRLINQKA
jgi:flagellar protein FlaG